MKTELIKNYFKDISIDEDRVVLSQSLLKRLQYNLMLVLKDPESLKMRFKSKLSILALSSSCGDYRLITFHYCDLSFFSERTALKIMHKGNILEWEDDKVKFVFSEKSIDGDIAGIMNGDYRDCFNAIHDYEKHNKILVKSRRAFEIGVQKKVITSLSGVGLESLTLVQKKDKNNKWSNGIFRVL